MKLTYADGDDGTVHLVPFGIQARQAICGARTDPPIGEPLNPGMCGACVDVRHERRGEVA